MVKPEDYAYDLPPELIAREPAPDRSGSRLFVYDTQTDKVTLDHFYNLPAFLPERSFLCLNETKVVPSRVILRKKTGGKVKALFLVNEPMPEGRVRLMADRKTEPGSDLSFASGETVRITGQDEHIFTASFAFPREHLYDLLRREGTMPIPLYIKNTPLGEGQLREKYQTVFARLEGSSAAPTASLHFTRELLDKLKEQGTERLFLTLHVGMGTFAPVGEKEIRKKKLHEEWYEVPPATGEKLVRFREEGRPLVAVGTTVVRTLESFAVKGTPAGTTDLFIYPPYRFRMVDALVTNFHLPGSSLMMLVEALLQHKKAPRRLVDLYRIAIAEKFRFFSFGDAMLIR